jgi:stage II sporulation protein D (peptidoglycan lytic transglycosylase)
MPQNMRASHPLVPRHWLLACVIAVASCSSHRAPATPSTPSSGATPRSTQPDIARIPRTLRIQTEDGRIAAIDLDTYVRGSVSAETWVRRDEDPDVAERLFEVQALVARTYAIANLGRHAADGFDLCSRTHCQLYRPLVAGARWEDAIATAVERTSGSMIAYDGAPILALFHANCGGRTSAAEDIWGGTARPYLVGVDDPECDTPAAHWHVTLARDALLRVFDADARTRVDGRLDSIDVLESDRAGRVMLAALTGQRSPVVRGEELRALLQRTFGARSIRSPRFVVHRDHDAFVFDGSGSGHGAGLCQFGALTRIRGGASARDVIEHYYRGAHVERIRIRDDT